MKFNNLELGLGQVLQFYASVVKRLKLKVRKFTGLIPTFFRSCRRKTGMAGFLPHILNRVKIYLLKLLLKLYKNIYPPNIYEWRLSEPKQYQGLHDFFSKINSGIFRHFQWNHFSQQSHWVIFKSLFLEWCYTHGNLQVQNTSNLTDLSGQYSTISVGSLCGNWVNFPILIHCRRWSPIALSLNCLKLILTFDNI